MIIKGNQVIVFDIEVFENCFSCICKNTETKAVSTFEISERKNNAKELINFFEERYSLFCGYNNHHYDDVIINFILINKDTLPDDYSAITKTFHTISKKIIDEQDFGEYKTYKYAHCYPSIDLLTMLFSSKLRVGLKEMQVTMKYPNVREYEGDFNKPIPVGEIDNMLSYNLNDVLSTEALLYKVEDQIKLRLGIEQEYGVDVLSKDGMSIGTEILKLKYLEKIGKSWYDIKDLRSPADIINLNDVIFPFIHFDTPVLKNLLDEMKSQSVSPGRKGYEKHFYLDGVEVTVGVGGIHTKNNPETIIPNENELLIDSDVNSLYPSLIISYGLVPKHLGKEFLEIYGAVREERLQAKRNKEKIKNETLKLALNGKPKKYKLLLLY